MSSGSRALGFSQAYFILPLALLYRAADFAVVNAFQMFMSSWRHNFDTNARKTQRKSMYARSQTHVHSRQWYYSLPRATFININAELPGLFWARHQREVRRSPPRSLCLQAPPSDRLRHGPQLSALTLSRRALVHLVSQMVERAPNRRNMAATQQRMSDNEQSNEIYPSVLNRDGPVTKKKKKEEKSRIKIRVCGRKKEEVERTGKGNEDNDGRRTTKAVEPKRRKFKTRLGLKRTGISRLIVRCHSFVVASPPCSVGWALAPPSD
ncbi:hypothetical protein M514_11337 [Trichuris suis]|uniref:Uncharacterized protein n=1 Tax=Trichuris suis TaxID=68888 RepID=A0A085MTD0_9BILA|nr:hypothetical protein M514_11337 [Trichuris suis]